MGMHLLMKQNIALGRHFNDGSLLPETTSKQNDSNFKPIPHLLMAHEDFNIGT